jgi:Ca-activated chloride channel family protein
MIELAAPAWLWLAVPVLLLPAQRWVTGRNVLAVPSGGSGFPGLRAVLAPLPLALRILGMLLVVVALARPRVTHRSVSVESEGLDIILALDTSGSMKAEDFNVGLQPVNRLQVAKGVIAEFVQKRPYDRIGVVVFGEEAFTQVPLTLDHATLVDMLEQVEIGVAGSQGTAVGTALAVSSKRVKDLQSKEKIVVLLTDGQSNAGRISPMEAAQAAAALGIKVYTIGVGGERTGLLSMLSEGVDVEGLTAIAEATGGRFFRATSTQSLQQVYTTIDELEPSTAEVRQLVQHEERFRWFLVPGLALLLADALLAATALRRGP